MNILLIQPKMNKRPMDTDLKTRMAPSLALLTLKALTPPGHEIRLLNENTGKMHLGKRWLKGVLPSRRFAPDLVALTVTVDVLPRAAKIAAGFRALGVPVVAGGIHVTACPQQCAPHFDALCIGMAERVWPRILADAEAGRLAPVYHDMEGITGAEICSPDYAFVQNSTEYLYCNVVSTSRGCPHRCDFCYNSCENATPFIKRPIPDVMADLEAIGTRHVMFIDDNFIASPAWAHDFLLGLRGRGLTWHVAVTTRILHHPDLLDLMEETGCQSLFIGFESVNPASLAGVNKPNRVEEYTALVDAIHRRGIMVNASMVFGLDGDGPETFDATLRWLVDSKVETLTSHIMTPYPGTECHRRLEAAGRITSRDLSRYNTAHVVFAPAGMDADTLQKGYLAMYRKFYSLRNIAKRYPTHSRQRRAYLLFNFLYRKYGRITSFVARLVPLGILGKIAARMAYPGSKRRSRSVPGAPRPEQT